MSTAAARDLRFIAFRIGEETFVIDIMAVRQIVPYSGVTHVATAPAFIEGVIALRNEVIPIIDMHKRLYGAAAQSEQQPMILITHGASGVIGLKAEDVQIVTLSSDRLLAAPAMVRGVRGEFLVGVAPLGDELLLVLDVDAVLTSDEQRELREATLS